MSTALNPHSFSTSAVETIEAEKNHSTFAASKGKELTSPEMDENISDSLKSKLIENRLLSENWRKLAEKIPLQQSKIDKIDKNHIKPADKVKCVLDNWKQLSSHTFNENSIKMKLQSIQLNDVISDVFSEDDDQHRNQDETFVPKVEDLYSYQISLLANLLDSDNGWLDLGHCLFENDKESLKIIEAFQFDYAGGGNPVNKFLKLLLQRRPLVTLDDFRDVCKETQREDVIQYAADQFGNIVFINQLNEMQLENFASVIRGNIVPSNWSDIASKFTEFSNDDLKKLDRERMIPNSYSPTIKLFEKIKQRLSLIHI